MANLTYMKLDQVKKATAAFEKLLEKDPLAKQEREEFERFVKAEKARRDSGVMAASLSPIKRKIICSTRSPVNCGIISTIRATNFKMTLMDIRRCD